MSWVPRVIEGTARIISAVPTAESKGDNVAKDESKQKADPQVEQEPAEEVTLANGSKIGDDTVLACGKCGARFYGKDAPDGVCPAIDSQTGAVCGGTMGPVTV